MKGSNMRPGERVSSRPPLELPMKAKRPGANLRREIIACAMMALILLGCAVAFWGT